MTGPQQLWQILITTKVSADHLKTLAYDLYYQKATAEGDASAAIDALAPKLGISPRFTYEALKRAAALYQDGTLGGDRKQVLEWLAHDYKNDRTWDAVSSLTKAFVEKIAHNVSVIQDAMAKQGPPAPPAAGKPVSRIAHVAKPAAAVAVPAKARIASVNPSVMEPKIDWRPQLMFFIGGTIASLILSLRNAHKRHRYSLA